VAGFQDAATGLVGAHSISRHLFLGKPFARASSVSQNPLNVTGSDPCEIESECCADRAVVALIIVGAVVGVLATGAILVLLDLEGSRAVAADDPEEETLV
jgi:hypothetical protein